MRNQRNILRRYVFCGNRTWDRLMYGFREQAVHVSSAFDRPYPQASQSRPESFLWVLLYLVVKHRNKISQRRCGTYLTSTLRRIVMTNPGAVPESFVSYDEW